MTDKLFVDTYLGDRNAPIEIAAVKTLINSGDPWCGLVHKITQGLYEWECDRINSFRSIITDHDRYGVDFFDGYYHYLDLHQDWVAQADFFWSKMEKIGGEKKGTLWAMVDVERGGQGVIPTSQQVFDGVGKWAERYHQLSGRLPTLYGGELLRSLGIHAPGAPINLLGCGRNSIALYGPRLTIDVIAATGTDPAHLLFWQYDGDGEAYLAGYPREAPGFGKIDISAMVLPGGMDAMKAQL